MIYYKLVQIIITTPVLAEVILNVVVWQHALLNFIISNYGFVFMSKF